MPGDTCVAAVSGRQIDRFLRLNPIYAERYLQDEFWERRAIAARYAPVKALVELIDDEDEVVRRVAAYRLPISLLEPFFTDSDREVQLLHDLDEGRVGRLVQAAHGDARREGVVVGVAVDERRARHRDEVVELVGADAVVDELGDGLRDAVDVGARQVLGDVPEPGHELVVAHVLARAVALHDRHLPTLLHPMARPCFKPTAISGPGRAAG